MKEDNRLRIAKYAYLDDEKSYSPIYQPAKSKKRSKMDVLYAVYVVSLAVFCFVLANLYSLEFQQLVTRVQKEFLVKEIRVLGNNRLSEEEVLRSASLNLSDKVGVWALDVQQIKQNLEKLPLVKKVSVKILLPSDLEISLEEREPRAIWYDLKTYHLVDKEGVILAHNIDFEANNKYLLIIGEGANSAFEQLLKTVAVHKVRSLLYAVQFVGHRRWNLLLNDGTIIKLPERGVLQSLAALDVLLEHYVPLQPFSLIDLRLAPEKIYCRF